MRFAILSLLLIAAPAQAGEQDSSAGCGPYLRYNLVTHTFQQVGYLCSGTFAGFRSSATPTDYAEFSYLSGVGSFNASFGGTSFSCVASSSLLPDWPMAIANRGYFTVWTDLNGNCTSLMVGNGSQFSSY